MLRFLNFLRRGSGPKTGRTLAESIDRIRPESLSGTRIRSSYNKPPFEKFYIYIFLLLLSFSISDSLTIMLRVKMIPESKPSKVARRPRIQPNIASYHNILDRNIFDSSGIIPPPIIQQESDNPMDEGNPIPSSLPLQLIGTIVHANPDKSIATIQLQPDQIIPYSKDDNIGDLATLVRVERRRAIFRNKSSNRLEFIKIDVEATALMPAIKSVPKASDAPVAEANNFNINRNDLNQYMEDLPNLLMQARAVPNVVDGRVQGFRVVDIQEGSIWEKLGLKRDDVIKGVNGEEVNSPAKAMELYNSLKNDSKVAIDIERDGSSETLNYSIL